MNRNAFSLIELLVVVAIIAILAAIAVPTYKQYQVRSRVANIMNIISGWANQSAMYAAIHGFFPTATQLGISSVPTAISQYASGLSIAGDSCGQSGYVGVTINPTGLGMTNGATNVGLFIGIDHLNGTFIYTCDYYQLPNSGYMDPDGSFPASCISQYNSAGVNPAWQTRVNYLGNHTCSSSP